jgi:hypothetical protein
MRKNPEPADTCKHTKKSILVTTRYRATRTFHRTAAHTGMLIPNLQTYTNAHNYFLIVMALITCNISTDNQSTASHKPKRKTSLPII